MHTHPGAADGNEAAFPRCGFETLGAAPAALTKYISPAAPETPAKPCNAQCAKSNVPKLPTHADGGDGAK